MVLIKKEASLGAPGLNSGVDKKQARINSGVKQKLMKPVWAWPNPWCQSRGRVSWMAVA